MYKELVENVWFEVAQWERPAVDDSLHEGIPDFKGSLKDALEYWQELNAPLRQEIKETQESFNKVHEEWDAAACSLDSHMRINADDWEQVLSGSKCCPDSSHTWPKFLLDAYRHRASHPLATHKEFVQLAQILLQEDTMLGKLEVEAWSRQWRLMHPVTKDTQGKTLSSYALALHSPRFEIWRERVDFDRLCVKQQIMCHGIDHARQTVACLHGIVSTLSEQHGQTAKVLESTKQAVIAHNCHGGCRDTIAAKQLLRTIYKTEKSCERALSTTLPLVTCRITKKRRDIFRSLRALSRRRACSLTP
jgi:hypothetical protein